MRDFKFLMGCFIIWGVLITHALAATSTMPVDANGNVGIGTTATLAGLQVGPGAQTFSPTPTLGATSALIKGNLEVDGKIYGDGSGLTGASQWTTSGSNIYYSAGNVGIGTASPGSSFEVANYVYFDLTDSNTKVGYEAGKNVVVGAAYNTFLGIGAGKSGVAGSTNAADSNVAVGYNAFFSNTTGSENSVVGANALYTNTTGNQNTAFGTTAAYKNDTGGGGTAIGYGALYWNASGAQNTAAGSYAAYNATGGYNTAVGADALRSNTSATYNTALGFQALYSNKTGSNATAVGAGAMYYSNDTTTPFTNYSVAVGFEALRGSTTAANNTGTYNTATGYQPLWSNTTGHDNSAFGHQALYSNTVANYVTAVGPYALYSNKAISNSTAVGYGAFRYANDTATAAEGYNTAVGYEALRGSTTAANNTGGSNTAVGYQALYSFTTGSTNTALGYKALYSDNTGYDNVAQGYQALYSNTSGNNNVALGANALYANIDGIGNVALGYEAGRYQPDGTTALTDPMYSIYIGMGSKGYSNADNNSIVIGYNAIGLGANTVVLGNDSITTTALRGNVGIGTTVPQQKLEVRGGAILGSEYAVTAAASMTIDMANGNQQYVTLNQAGHTINLSNYKVGQVVRLILCQDGTGGRTVTTWDSSIVWASGSAPSLTATASKCDMISFVCGNAKGSVKNFGTVTVNF